MGDHFKKIHYVIGQNENLSFDTMLGHKRQKVLEGRKKKHFLNWYALSL